MASVIPGYEYDIFISYRQKDNKADQWVTHFVDALKDELDATFKEDISIYFDENPHDGLLETHDVDQSLKNKIKALVFIPIISQTYCDPNSFAWQYEFIPFRDFAQEDELGLNIHLPSGNVCKRILPVRIHEIDVEDQALYEEETGGVMRSIDFIYKASGVNRPLTTKDDEVQENNQVFYRNQINKVANGIKEIVNALLPGDSDPDVCINKSDKLSKSTPAAEISKKTILITSFLVLLLSLTAIWYFKYYNQPQILSEESRNARVAIIPFANNTNDPELDVLGEMAADWITKGLMNFGHIKVVSYETVRDNIDFAVLKDSNLRASFADRTGADKVIKGSFYLQGDDIVFLTQVIAIENGEVELVLPEVRGIKSNPEELVVELKQRVMTIFDLDIMEKRLLLGNTPPKFDAYKSYAKALEYFGNDYKKSQDYIVESIRLDSNFLSAYIGLYLSYKNQGRLNESNSILSIMNKKFKNASPFEQLQLDFANSETNWEMYSTWKKIYDRDPKNFTANLNMAIAAKWNNRPYEVVEICQNLNPKNIKIKFPAQLWWFSNYSYNLIRINRLDEALEVLEVVPPEHMDYLYYYEAIVYDLKDQPHEIHKIIEEMVEQGLSWNLILETYLNTSNWYALQGDNTKQKEWAQLALDKINSHLAKDETSKWNIAWAYYNTGNYNKALSIYKVLIADNRRTPIRISRLGLCYANSGSPEMAKSIISELDKINTASSKYAMAQIYAALNEKELAIKYLKEAFKLDYGFSKGNYDTDFELVPLHGYPEYEKLVKPKG